MTISSLLQLEDILFTTSESHDVVSLVPVKKQHADGITKHVAVIHSGNLEYDLVTLFNHARDLGALAAVKLIAVEGTQLYLFLDSGISSSSFPAIEGLWKQALDANDCKAWLMAFSDINEVLTGRSHYAFGAHAKRILESLIEAETQPAESHPAPGASASARPLVSSSPYLPQRVKDAMHEEPTWRSNAVDDHGRSDPSYSERPTTTGEAPITGSDTLSGIRAQCFKALLDAGVRPQELRKMKVGDHSDAPTQCFRVVRHKARNPQKPIMLSHHTAELLAGYISASGLSAEHYLFPSPHSPSAPMRQREFRSIWEAWMMTSPRAASHRMNVIREFQRELNIALIASQLSGHYSLDILHHYLPKADEFLVAEALVDKSSKS